ncbi:MAG: dihydrodipicolinate synthase family protein [Actinomycetes bacterium]
MKSDFSGSYSVLVTPFTEGGAKVDVPALKSFLDWQIESGVPGVIMLGTTGEFLALTDDERRTVVETTVKHINKRIPVLVGTMNAYTPNAVRYSKEAQELGADGLMILPPYYYTPTHDEVFNYYKAICEAVQLPIMIYNNPFTSNVDLPAVLIAKIARAFEQIRYIKEASTDVARVRDVIEASDGLVKVFAGERVVDSYLLGAIGYVNPYGNYIPHASSEICNLLDAGRIEDARKVQRMIDNIDHIIAEGHPTYGHQCYSKALAAMTGHPVGDVRPPLTTFAQLGQEGVERVEKIKVLMAQLDSLMADLAK